MHAGGGNDRSAADFLGVDEGELTGHQVGEVVCELANMICGSVLSRMESAATFRIAPPKLADCAEDRAQSAALAAEKAASHSVRDLPEAA